MKKIYQRFEGIIYESIKEYETFTHLKSHFNDEWYNFILPHTSPPELDWEKVQQVLQEEKKQGYTLSYYIPKSLLAEYTEYFTKKGNQEIGTDSYLFFQNKQFKNVAGSIVEINDNTIEQYIEFAKICFPTWENGEYYSRYFYELQKNDKTRFIRNYLYYIDNKPVGGGALTILKPANLAYFHNIAIAPEERKKGYFTNMIKHFINVSIEQSVSESSALTEENSPAFLGFKKLGFTVEDIFYLFETS